MSLIHKNDWENVPRKASGGALHPLPSVSASPRATRTTRISTDVEDSVDNRKEAQVTAFRSFPEP